MEWGGRGVDRVTLQEHTVSASDFPKVETNIGICSAYIVCGICQCNKKVNDNEITLKETNRKRKSGDAPSQYKYVMYKYDTHHKKDAATHLKKVERGPCSPLCIVNV